MSLKFEDNTVTGFDVKKTFGKLYYLSNQPIYESGSEGSQTDMIREQRLTVYAEAKSDQVEIALPEQTDFSSFSYDEEVELTGVVSARGWLSTYKGYNDTIQSEQAFKIRAEGVKKAVRPAAPNQSKPEKDKQHPNA